MVRLHFVINYIKIPKHLWTPHRLNKYSWRKNVRDLLPPQYVFYGKKMKKMAAAQLHTDRQVAVERCGRFIMTRKSVLYFKSSGKVKSK